MDSNLKHLVALSQFAKFGPTRLRRLKKAFPLLEKAFISSLSELKHAGIEEKVANEFIAARTEIRPDEIMAALDREQIKVVALEDDDYPKLLAQIYSPPALLYYKGNIENINDYTLAVVGTRKFTAYGKQVVENIVSPLVKSGLIIISGLAVGIDTLSHLTCLDMGGRTIAVLGTGIDKQSIYPSANRYLADKIVTSGGAVITEFPLRTQPWRYNFPLRNRIISGLSLGTLVVEAGEKSGALITGQLALDQNREIFSVPGNIYSPVSRGTNALIKQGAKPITSADDILETLDLTRISSYIDNKKIIPESKEEAMILESLSHESVHIDDLIRSTNLTTATTSSTLTLMEMKGMVRNIGNMRYVLAR